MTTRERLERKSERLNGWAGKRMEKASAALNSHPEMRHDWAFLTQPGRIPQRARMNRADDRAMESMNVAEGMTARAEGIDRMLERNIFSDDENAIEAIEAKIKVLEDERERMKEENASYKKGPAAYAVYKGVSEEVAIRLVEQINHYPNNWEKKPFATYQLTNLGANIRRLKQRVEEITRQKAKTAEAEANGGVTIRNNEYGYTYITFADKPDYSVIQALKANGFRWQCGTWCGETEKVPAGIGQK